MDNPEIEESVKDAVKNHVVGLQTGIISADTKTNILQDLHCS
jgi:hypothetical protein